ncbi:hypothetical protein [Streptomyces sp. NPDC002324]
MIGKVPAIWAACKAKDSVGEEVTEAANDAWSDIVHSFASAAADLIETLATSWLGLDSPQLSSDGGPVGFIFAHTQWLTLWVSALTLLIAAGHMAWTQRSEPIKEAAVAMLRVILTGGAAVAVVNVLLTAGDEFSVWIVNASTQCGGGTEATKACNEAFMNKLVTGSILVPQKGQILGLVLVFALLLIVGSIAQIGFMLARNAMLIVLVSTLPLAAAASGTPTGRAWFKKSTGWLVAFVLYKPVAAIVYAAGFASLTQGGDSAEDTNLMVQISGVVLLILAALTLPALMRIATPLVDAVAQGGQGSGSGVISGVGAIASGAVAIKTGGASAAATGAGRGASGATGSKMAGGARGAAPGSKAPGGSPQPPSTQPTGAPSPQQADGAPPAQAPHGARSQSTGGQAPQPASVPSGASTREGGGQPQLIAPRGNTETSEEGPRGSG